jgi:signal transduction histidine kinase
MTNNHFDRARAFEPFEDGSGPSSGQEAASPRWHSLILSSSDYSTDNELLERTFQELVRFYRHSSVGCRTLGIVHQMNTPLQVLSFQLDLLEQNDQKALDLLHEFSLTGTDAAKLIKLSCYRQEKFRQLRIELEKLQDYSRALVQQGMHEDTQEKLHLDLNRLCQQELELYLANPVFKHQVTREFHFEDGLPLIYGHHIDFSQSFRNLIDNALEAMEGMDQRQLTVSTARADRHLVVRIGDTGVGIPPENLPRIFDPFFTTKRTAAGVRAGLGLFLVRRLLAPYKAEIRVDSVPGKTWLTVSLPLV